MSYRILSSHASYLTHLFHFRTELKGHLSRLSLVGLLQDDLTSLTLQ